MCSLRVTPATGLTYCRGISSTSPGQCFPSVLALSEASHDTHDGLLSEHLVSSLLFPGNTSTVLFCWLVRQS